MIKDIKLVEYCGACSLPTDYCEYGGCKKESNSEELHKTVNTEKCTELSINGDDSVISESNTREDESKSSKKKTKQKQIIIKVESRARRKNVTVVTGLEHFSVQLNEAAKKFAKQFSCGASVVKGNNGKSDQIDVQGDFNITIAEFILKLYPHVGVGDISIQ
ncbi:hypothetical protein FG386_002668 [Cryptosporidium ryanae]|uniref:uncharacterized protein n=1 Tax=Cryptosporidium ryanae TaxID=515981 RepID=UPI00351AA0CF|nr:hypothetical protein FG386_002668 [Cryptosporidium ryanae]